MRSVVKKSTILAVCAVILKAAPPAGWYMAGSKPADYESNVDSQMIYDGRPSASLASKKPSIDGFGTLMQNFSAEKYIGQRVRFSAFVKSSGGQSWAGLWIRVDGPGQPPKMLAFDNMQQRPIRGDADWKNYEVVLDVPEDAKEIFFGILLAGTGTVWMNSANFEIVGKGVPTTEIKHATPEARRI